MRLKFRVAGEFRDIPLPEYVNEAIDKQADEHGTTSDAGCPEVPVRRAGEGIALESSAGRAAFIMHGRACGHWTWRDNQ
jgi:hypothetical protein